MRACLLLLSMTLMSSGTYLPHGPQIIFIAEPMMSNLANTVYIHSTVSILILMYIFLEGDQSTCAQYKPFHATSVLAEILIQAIKYILLDMYNTLHCVHVPLQEGVGECLAELTGSMLTEQFVQG